MLRKKAQTMKIVGKNLSKKIHKDISQFDIWKEMVQMESIQHAHHTHRWVSIDMVKLIR